MVKEDIEPRDNVPISNRFNGAKFPGVLLVALRAPSLLGPEGDVDTGPHVARVSAPPGKVMCTHLFWCGDSYFSSVIPIRLYCTTTTFYLFLYLPT